MSMLRMLILTLPYLNLLWVQLERSCTSLQYIYHYKTFKTFQIILQDAYLSSCLRGKIVLSLQSIVKAFIHSFIQNQIMWTSSFKLSKGFLVVFGNSSQNRGPGNNENRSGKLEGGWVCLGWRWPRWGGRRSGWCTSLADIRKLDFTLKELERHWKGLTRKEHDLTHFFKRLPLLCS